MLAVQFGAKITRVHDQTWMNGRVELVRVVYFGVKQIHSARAMLGARDLKCIPDTISG